MRDQGSSTKTKAATTRIILGDPKTGHSVPSIAGGEQRYSNHIGEFPSARDRFKMSDSIK